MPPVDRLRAALTALVPLLLAGCAAMGGLAPRGTPMEPAQLAAHDTLAPADVDAHAVPDDRWWTRLGDPQLDALIDAAIVGSPSLAIARARLDKATGLAGIAGAPLAPQIDGRFAVNRQRYSENGIFPPPIGGATYTQSDLALALNYELDLWGQHRADYDRALGETKAAEIEMAAARLLLAADVAHTYVQLQRAFAQLDVAQDTLKQREAILALTRERVDAGLDSRMELKQAEAAVPAAREQVIALDAMITRTRYQIAALLGQGPDRGASITRPNLQSAAVGLPSRLPADLVGRRPDVVAQRWRVRAASRAIDHAKAQFYPNIDLTAVLGSESIDIGKLLQSGSAAPLVGAAIRLPLFAGGRLRGQLVAADADYDAAVARYNETLVNALREVVDRLATLRAIDAQRTQVQSSLASAQDAYDLALRRYRAGVGNYLQVLSAESLVFDQRMRDADNRTEALTASIDLMRALGGGFDDRRMTLIPVSRTPS